MRFVSQLLKNKISTNTYMAVRRASVNDATSCAPIPIPCITRPSMVTENFLEIFSNTVNVNYFSNLIVYYNIDYNLVSGTNIFFFFKNHSHITVNQLYTYVGPPMNGTGPIRLNPIMSMMHPSNVTTLAGSTLSHSQPHQGAVNA